MVGKAQDWVTMVDPSTGSAVEVHPDDVQAAQDEQGLTIETPEQAGLRQYQQGEGRTFVEGAKSFGEHLLSSATLGAFDWAASQSPEYREARKMRDATFKAPSVAGEAAGFLLPGLGEVKALGVAGKAAKVVGAPVAAVSRVAGTAGRTVERVLAGEAAGGARAAIAKVAGGAVTGAVEGGAIGAGQALTEASIENRDLTAEMLLSHVKGGAEFGGLLGGAVSAGAKAFSAIGRKGVEIAGKTPVISDMLGGTRGAAALGETKALTAMGALGSDIKRIVKEGGPDAPARIGRRILEEGGFTGEGAMGRAVRHDLDSAKELATERVNHYGERISKVYDDLEATGQKANVATVIQDVETRVLAKLRESPFRPDHALAKRIQSDLEPLYASVRRADDIRVARELGDNISETYTKLNAALSGKATISRPLLTYFEREASVTQQHLRTIGLGSAAKELEAATSYLRYAYEQLNRGGKIGSKFNGRIANAKRAFSRFQATLDSSAKSGGVAELSYKELWKLRQRVDKQVKHWGTTQDPRASAYQDLRTVLKDQVDAQASKTGLAKEFRESNAGYADWIQVKRIAEERAASTAGNRSVGLTDTIAGVGSAAVFGGGIGGLAAGAASILANKFIRSAAGDRVMATVANSYSNWRKLTQATSDTAQQISTRVTNSIRTESAKANLIGFTERVTSQFNRQRDAVLAREDQRDKYVASFHDALAPVMAGNPDLAESTALVLSRGNAHLASILPTSPGFSDLMSGTNLDPQDVPESEKLGFLDREKLVRDPTRIIGDMRDGTITPEQVETLRATSPELYSLMSRALVSKLADQASRQRVPDYQDRLNAGIFLGVPVDATARPEVIAAYQRVHALMKAQQPPPSAARPSGTSLKRFARNRANSTDDRES